MVSFLRPANSGDFNVFWRGQLSIVQSFKMHMYAEPLFSHVLCAIAVVVCFRSLLSILNWPLALSLFIIIILFLLSNKSSFSPQVIFLTLFSLFQTFCTPVIITSLWVITARYVAILNQSECKNICDHLSNGTRSLVPDTYTNKFKQRQIDRQINRIDKRINFT